MRELKKYVFRNVLSHHKALRHRIQRFKYINYRLIYRLCTFYAALLTLNCFVRGHAVVQLVEALRHKTGGSGLDSRWVSLKFASDPIILSAFNSPGLHSAWRQSVKGTYN